MLWEKYGILKTVVSEVSSWIQYYCERTDKV